MQHFRVFLSGLVVFVALDAVWLIYVANAFFKSELGSLLRAQPDLAVAAIFYLVYVGGLTILAVIPSLRKQSVQSAIWKGAVLGFTAYSTFDLTSLAIIQGWTYSVALVDIAWGTILSAVASLAAYGASRRSFAAGRGPAG